MATQRKKKKSEKSFSHTDARGAARMVDVSSKPITVRRAIASAELCVAPHTLSLIADAKIPKGDVLAAAHIAGIAAAKRTADLIPLCHPLSLDSVEINIRLQPPNRIIIRSEIGVTARTGAEMEAMTSVSIAALTLYDMCKSVDRGMVIGPIQLEMKSGGRSGKWQRG